MRIQERHGAQILGPHGTPSTVHRAGDTFTYYAPLLVSYQITFSYYQTWMEVYPEQNLEFQILNFFSYVDKIDETTNPKKL